MGLVSAGRMAEADGYVGYMEPYATSHEALDEDRAFQQEVVNAAQTLGNAVRLARLGRLDNPGGGLVSPSRNRIQCGPAPPEQGLVLRGATIRAPVRKRCRAQGHLDLVVRTSADISRQRHRRKNADRRLLPSMRHWCTLPKF